MMFFVAAWTYSLAVNFVPAYRDVADKFSTTGVGIDDLTAEINDEEKGSRDAGSDSDRGKNGVTHAEDGSDEYIKGV